MTILRLLTRLTHRRLARDRRALERNLSDREVALRTMRAAENKEQSR